MDQIVQQHSYFKREEFACGCGCGFDDLSPVLWETLDRVRQIVDRPIVINSGCRCRRHNDAVGGSVNSSHLNGWAVDIRTPAGSGSGEDDYRSRLVRALIHSGCNRIGIGKSFVHVDIDPIKSERRMWVYM